ncbi:hypothetical protein CASFOL_003505 [Castilleja foliolosa]|uniref:Uncharacterized protein n=1 Tax=Castilleja foliolosa TaxID=1961234 RepID=A0ABD3EL94_9LAMI
MYSLFNTTETKFTPYFLQEDDDLFDPETNNLHQPLLKRNRTLSSSPLAIVGTKVSHIESLDYDDQ